MQDNWQDFDRHIQSVMRDAREKVPGRVWRGVAARLDSAAAAAAWWKWAVPAFVAAALVAGLFFAGTRGSQNASPDKIQIIADSGVEEESSTLLAQADIEPEVVPVEAAAAPVRRSPKASRSGAVSSQEVSSGSEPDNAQEAIVDEPSVVDESAAGPKDNQDQDNSEQWARIIEGEGAARGAGIDLSNIYASGGVGGNDSNISDGGIGISRMAPGSGSPDAGDKKAEKGVLAAIRKYGKYALLFLVVLLVFPRLGLDYLTGSGNLTGFKIYGAVSVILLFGALVFIWALADSETAKKNMVLQIAGSVIAVGASAAILVWNPVSDLWFYGGSILAAAGVCLSFLGIISKYNILATRPLPTFYDRKGGNDRAK